jgi:hypothetical protein
MPQFRIFTVGPDGHFSGPARVVECADDKQAIRQARQFVDGLDVEVWESGRFITLLSNKPRAQGAH